jgi:hypothetical protein
MVEHVLLITVGYAQAGHGGVVGEAWNLGRRPMDSRAQARTAVRLRMQNPAHDEPPWSYGRGGTFGPNASGQRLAGGRL